MMALRTFENLVELSEHKPRGACAGHRHFAAYAAFALHGEYTEISADGMLNVGPGDIIVHPSFHWHANVFADSPVEVLNLMLPMPFGFSLSYTRLRLAELSCSADDVLHRPSESAAVIAAALARYDSGTQAPADRDAAASAWRKLKQPQAPKIHRIAMEWGISSEHLSRTFRVRYGLSPAAYRAEHRFRHALRALFDGEAASAAAHASGYADQSHMTRDFKRRISMTPMRLALQLRDCRSTAC